MSARISAAYRIVDSPIGRLLLADSGKGLVRVAFECEGFYSVLEELEGRLDRKVIDAPQRLGEITAQLNEYFDSARREFDLQLDISLVSGTSGSFQAEVQRYLPNVGYGKTETYKDVALSLGRPRAIRAVGTACARNPLPIVLPCHRIIRTDGSLGGYRGGLSAKKILLDLESR